MSELEKAIQLIEKMIELGNKVTIKSFEMIEIYINDEFDGIFRIARRDLFFALRRTSILSSQINWE